MKILLLQKTFKSCTISRSAQIGEQIFRLPTPKRLGKIENNAIPISMDRDTSYSERIAF